MKNRKPLNGHESRVCRVFAGRLSSTSRHVSIVFGCINLLSMRREKKSWWSAFTTLVVRVGWRLIREPQWDGRWERWRGETECPGQSLVCSTSAFAFYSLFEWLKNPSRAGNGEWVFFLFLLLITINWQSGEPGLEGKMLMNSWWWWLNRAFDDGWAFELSTLIWWAFTTQNHH